MQLPGIVKEKPAFAIGRRCELPLVFLGRLERHMLPERQLSIDDDRTVSIQADLAMLDFLLEQGQTVAELLLNTCVLLDGGPLAVFAKTVRVLFIWQVARNGQLLKLPGSDLHNPGL